MTTFVTTTTIGNILQNSIVNRLNDNQFIHLDTGTIINSDFVTTANSLNNQTNAASSEFLQHVSSVLLSIDLHIEDGLSPYATYSSNSEDDSMTFNGSTELFPSVTIKVGEGYRAYSRTTNRWDYFVFERTATDIGRFMSGFALKCPSSKSSKIRRLIAINIMYDLKLNETDIQESVNN